MSLGHHVAISTFLMILKSLSETIVYEVTIIALIGSDITDEQMFKSEKIVGNSG